MAISFQCAQCGKVFRVPNAHAGRRGKCQQCGRINQIPQAARVEGASATPPRPQGAAKGEFDLFANVKEPMRGQAAAAQPSVKRDAGSSERAESLDSRLGAQRIASQHVGGGEPMMLGEGDLVDEGGGVLRIADLNDDNSLEAEALDDDAVLDERALLEPDDDGEEYRLAPPEFGSPAPAPNLLSPAPISRGAGNIDDLLAGAGGASALAADPDDLFAAGASSSSGIDDLISGDRRAATTVGGGASAAGGNAPAGSFQEPASNPASLGVATDHQAPMSGQTKLLVALGGAAVLAVLIVAALIIFGGDEEPLEQRPASAETASADPPPADRDEADPFANPNSTSFEQKNAGRADASSGPTHGRARKSV